MVYEVFDIVTGDRLGSTLHFTDIETDHMSKNH